MYVVAYNSLWPLQGPVSRKSRELFGAEKLVVKLESACFQTLIFQRVGNARKTKRIAKFDGLEPRCCEDIKGIGAPRNRPEKFRDFWETGPRWRHKTGVWKRGVLNRDFFCCMLWNQSDVKLSQCFVFRQICRNTPVAALNTTPVYKPAYATAQDIINDNNRNDNCTFVLQ